MLAVWSNSSPQSYSWVGQLYGHMYSARTTGVEGPAGSRVWDTDHTLGLTGPHSQMQLLRASLTHLWLCSDLETDIVPFFGDIPTYEKPHCLSPRDPPGWPSAVTLRLSDLRGSMDKEARVHLRPLRPLPGGFFVAMDRKEAQGTVSERCLGSSNHELGSNPRGPIPPSQRATVSLTQISTSVPEGSTEGNSKKGKRPSRWLTK